MHQRTLSFGGFLLLLGSSEKATLSPKTGSGATTLPFGFPLGGLEIRVGAPFTHQNLRVSANTNKTTHTTPLLLIKCIEQPCS